MNIFKSLNDQGKTVILISHENDIAEFADRIIVFKDGIIVEEKRRNGSRFTTAENVNS